MRQIPIAPPPCFEELADLIRFELQGGTLTLEKYSGATGPMCQITLDMDGASSISSSMRCENREELAQMFRIIAVMLDEE